MGVRNQSQQDHGVLGQSDLLKDETEAEVSELHADESNGPEVPVMWSNTASEVQRRNNECMVRELGGWGTFFADTIMVMEGVGRVQTGGIQLPSEPPGDVQQSHSRQDRGGRARVTVGRTQRCRRNTTVLPAALESFCAAALGTSRGLSGLTGDGSAFLPLPRTWLMTAG